jgi:hypothetical protein
MVAVLGSFYRSKWSTNVSLTAALLFAPFEMLNILMWVIRYDEGSFATSTTHLKIHLMRPQSSALAGSESVSRWSLLLLLCSCAWLHASATTTLLYSISELQSILKSAAVGDHLVLADGRYSFDGTLLIDTDGVTLSAESAGGVIFGDCQLNIRLKCDGATLSGIQFINSHALDQRNIIDVFGSRNQLIDLNFDGCSADKYVCIRAGGSHNTIQSSNFQNKPTSSKKGNLIEIQASCCPIVCVVVLCV